MRTPKAIRQLALGSLLLVLVAGCAAPPSRLPPQVTVASLATATSAPTSTLSPEERTQQRFLPLLLTLDDFSDGVMYSDQALTDSTTTAIRTLATFSESVGYSFSHPGSDFLGGVTGFLGDNEMVANFDEQLATGVNDLLVRFGDLVLDEEQSPLAPKDRPFAAEIPANTIPPDVLWASDIGYVDERLVRLDAVGFRRGSIGVYLIYVSAPANEPLIDIAATINLLEARIRTNAGDTY